MISLAALRYRDVLVTDGGPIASVQAGPFHVGARPLFQANAWLREGLVRKRLPGLYSSADGTGTDAVLSVARHKAISEALERWAFHSTVRGPRAKEFGFDVDPTSNGMSAFPGLGARAARRAAMLEGIERYCLIAWWEGRVAGKLLDTDWPGVSAVAINGPFGGIAVIVFARTEWGGFAYGHAAEESLGAAMERAMVELARHEWVLRSAWLQRAAGCPLQPRSRLEARALFFATPEGHERFQARLHAAGSDSPLQPELICDRELPGPWSEYATVWRFALRPCSDAFLSSGEDYFFL